MIKLDIISGFLGSGKTTLIQKMLVNDQHHEKIVVIENEFGEMGIDGASLAKNGISVKELYSGCICCTLSGDFKKTIEDVIHTFAPDRIIIEPSGVGMLSQVIKACDLAAKTNALQINMKVTVVDAQKFYIYLTNFGAFFEDQIKHGHTIFLSRTESIPQEDLQKVIAELRRLNETAVIVSTPIAQLTSEQVRSVAEEAEEPYMELFMREMKFSTALLPQEERLQKRPTRGGKVCSTVKKAVNTNCTHHHSADETFEAWGEETSYRFSEGALRTCLEELKNKEQYGYIVRGKGIVQTDTSQWVQFEYSLGEIALKHTTAEPAGKLCIIGSKINRSALNALFFGA